MKTEIITEILCVLIVLLAVISGSAILLCFKLYIEKGKLLKENIDLVNEVHRLRGRN